MSVKVKVLIHELINQRGITLEDLSRITAIPLLTLEELANEKREDIEITDMKKIAEALDINDIREIIDLIKI